MTISGRLTIGAIALLTLIVVSQAANAAAGEPPLNCDDPQFGAKIFDWLNDLPDARREALLTMQAPGSLTMPVAPNPTPSTFKVSVIALAFHTVRTTRNKLVCVGTLTFNTGDQRTFRMDFDRRQTGSGSTQQPGR